jgi:hypothetical protein
MNREIIFVSSEIHIEHIKTLCAQNIEQGSVKYGGTVTGYKGFSRSKPTPNIHHCRRV